jgi:hypothetical protein
MWQRTGAQINRYTSQNRCQLQPNLIRRCDRRSIFKISPSRNSPCPVGALRNSNIAVEIDSVTGAIERAKPTFWHRLEQFRAENHEQQQGEVQNTNDDRNGGEFSALRAVLRETARNVGHSRSQILANRREFFEAGDFGRDAFGDLAGVEFQPFGVFVTANSIRAAIAAPRIANCTGKLSGSSPPNE